MVLQEPYISQVQRKKFKREALVMSVFRKALYPFRYTKRIFLYKDPIFYKAGRRSIQKSAVSSRDEQVVRLLRIGVATGATAYFYYTGEKNESFILLPDEPLHRRKIVLACLPFVSLLTYLTAPYIVLVGTAYAGAELVVATFLA
jgi:hypothetical protein